MLPLEGNDRLSSSSKGRVRENFLINQQMSTFTTEIRIESAESARVPSGELDSAVPARSIASNYFSGLKIGKPGFNTLHGQWGVEARPPKFMAGERRRCSTHFSV